MRLSAMQKLNNMYLHPILRFSGLYVNDDGFICNANSNIPYKNYDDDRIYIVLDNYRLYEKYMKSKEEYIPFNPYINEKHLVIITKFFRNAIFQMDSEFNDFFYSINVDQDTGEIFKEERLINDEEVFLESEKHIILVNIPPDYRNKVRKRWVIHTNIKNQIIDKMISEVCLSKDFPMNVGIILSMKEVVEYYDVYNQQLIFNPNKEFEIENEAINMLELITKMGSESKTNKKKFINNVQQEFDNDRDYLYNVEHGKKGYFGEPVLPTDVGNEYD